MLSPHWLKVDKSACEFINLQIRLNDSRGHYLRRSESEQCRFIIGLIPFRSADSTAFPRAICQLAGPGVEIHIIVVSVDIILAHGENLWGCSLAPMGTDGNALDLWECSMAPMGS